MILKLIVDEQIYELNVPEEFLLQAGEFFDQMDRDMDQGWQMGRDWVDNPNLEQRCQIAANKLLTALENENPRLGRLVAGYILSRMPGVDTIEPDTHGEIQNTLFQMAETLPPEPPARPVASEGMPAGLDKMAALEQAGRDVTKVFKVGRHWRFSVYDHAGGQWQDSPALGDKQEAEHLRQEAFRERYQALAGKSSP